MSHDDEQLPALLTWKFARPVFLLYAIALAIGTHIPGVRIEGSVPRPDILVHVAAFGMWATLLIWCRFFGAALSWRNVFVSAGIAVIYAAIDEATQGIPALKRTVAIEDFLAGVLGVVGAVFAAWMARVALQRSGGLFGPPIWILMLIAGLVLGGLATIVMPPTYLDAGLHEIDTSNGGIDETHDEKQHVESPDEHASPVVEGENHEEAAEDVGHEADASHGMKPTIPLILVAPFAALLLSIALMPFVSERFWHHHFADFAFFFGGLTAGYYLLGFTEPYTHGMTYGVYQMFHVGQEYVAFIALVGGLYVASGGVVVDIRGRGRPMANVTLLAFGAVIANVVGTTGASMLLIRPFMRLNEGRLRAVHIVMFILIVSNCGGALTPIGDPPLYLGYLKGVPFFWTAQHLFPMWLTCVGALLMTSYIVDHVVERRLAPVQVEQATGYGVRVRGLSGIIALGVIIGAVFIDPYLAGRVDTRGVPVGPVVQLVAAAVAYFVAPKANLASNEFNFFPVKEVGLLFVGIFATMAPALGYLAFKGDSLGIDTPTKFYFATGMLSGVLDNAPTYANFLQIAFGSGEMSVTSLRAFLSTTEGAALVRAVSLGAVFFGAFTYIGNGPNFMVKALAERSGVRMPSFFGYIFRALIFLSPAVLLVWVIFIR